MIFDSLDRQIIREYHTGKIRRNSIVDRYEAMIATHKLCKIIKNQFNKFLKSVLNDYNKTTKADANK